MPRLILFMKAPDTAFFEGITEWLLKVSLGTLELNFDEQLERVRL